MTEIQKELFKIYLETRKVCDRLELKLIASGGTLLGAVRHKGFIPWDNDMDFYMLRDDYDKFCNKGNRIIDKKYFVQCHKTDHDWYKEYCRVRKNNSSAIEGNPYVKCHQGLFIDIFPLDVVPEKEGEYLKHIVRSREVFKRVSFHWLQQKSTFKAKILHLRNYYRLLIKHPFVSVSFNTFDKNAKKFNRSKNNYYGIFWFVTKTKFKTGRLFVYPKSLFKNVYDVPFEYSTITIIPEYDKFLTQQYGNWHQIPTPENRGSSFHTVYIYDFNKDYREYIKDKELMSKIRKKY